MEQVRVDAVPVFVPQPLYYTAAAGIWLDDPAVADDVQVIGRAFDAFEATPEWQNAYIKHGITSAFVHVGEAIGTESTNQADNAELRLVRLSEAKEQVLKEHSTGPVSEEHLAAFSQLHWGILGAVNSLRQAL